MTIPSTRPNFFLLLALDPDEPWDPASYQKTLQDKIRQWNRDSMSIAKKALPAQANRALLSLIRQIMENPTLREQEADEARKLFASRYAIAQKQFEKQLVLLNLKEQVEPEEIDRFVEEFKHVAPATAIHRRITVKVRTAQQSEQTCEPLDASIAKNIADRLEVLRLKTLYEFLQCSPKSTTAMLLRTAQELYAQEVRQHPTAEVTARVELAGFAMNLFKTNEMRARYDKTLGEAVLQQLLHDLADSLKRSAIKEVHPRQTLYYLKKAAQAGWQEQEALEQLKEYGRTHHWFITVPTRIAPAKQHNHDIDNLPDMAAHLIPVNLTQPPAQVENVQQLQYYILHSAIRLYWQWPDGCQAVYISYGGRSEDIEHHSSAVTTLYVTRLEYEEQGFYDIKGVIHQRLSILISAITEHNGLQATASGVMIHIHLHKTTLTYEIQPPRLLYRRRTIYIVADKPGPIPALVLVSKSGSLPTQRADGNIFHRIEGRVNKKGEMSIDLPNLPLPSPTFAKLFLEDDRLYNTIIIHHPSSYEQLRLS
ncbi:MAG TPA: hypothetical protein VL485_32870 [Ktedonobacteraceae bacterium]|nr:hypothetical protein [Ktedonobacteraceae bacterium]